jgi:hypothetical protein
MLRESPILPIRIKISPDGSGSIRIGGEEIAAQVSALTFYAEGEGRAPRLALEVWSNDVEIDGVAIVEVPREAGGFVEAADLIESMDLDELKREAANSLGKGRVKAFDRGIEIIAERLRKAGAG